jgi:hypothetical protein
VGVDAPLGLLIAATVTNAAGVGATLDQAIKQMPARHRIGVRTYSRYSSVADLRNGLFWYIPLAIVWIASAVAAVITGFGNDPSGTRAVALIVVAAGLVGHILITGLIAVPTLRRQTSVADDEDALERLFDRFARWNAIRAIVDGGSLVATVVALVATITGS